MTPSDRSVGAGTPTSRIDRLAIRIARRSRVSPSSHHVAAKIRSGGLGALVLAGEIAKADACGVVTELRYYHDTGICAKPNCGDATKYPPPSTGGCQDCTAGHHCCVCRDYNDGKALPNVLVNGGYSCTVYCTTLGFTVISDTPC